MSKIVSVIIPVYNSEEFIASCIDSLLKQSFNNFEIICVNDGSTDNSAKIIEEYVNKYPNRVRLLEKENGGCGSARNMGIDNSISEYVVFIDSDDIVREDMIEVLYNNAQKYNSDLVVCGLERIDEITGKTYTKDMVNVKKEVIHINENNLNELLFINPGPCNKIFKRTTLKTARFPKIPVVDDLMLMLQYIPEIKTVSFVTEVLYFYKVRSESGSNTVEYSTFEKMKEKMVSIKNDYIEKGLPKSYIEYIDKMAFIHVGISILYRMSYLKEIKMTTEIKNTKKFLNENFSSWKKISLIKALLSFDFRKICIAGVAFLYKINLTIIFIKIYRFMIDKLKIDIKW
jgi:glycosyltransferase involved in cell wall biosynthesis